MTNLRRAALVLTALCVAAPTVLHAQALQPAAGWFTYMPAGGGFAVLMPVSVKETAETTDDPKVGPYSTHISTSYSGPVLYLSGWIQYSTSLNIKAGLDANRDNFTRGVNGKLTGETEITFAGHPGREFTAETADAFFISRMCIADNDRAYMLVVRLPRGTDDTRNISRFFASFVLNK
jgi:hypothetical protein